MNFSELNWVYATDRVLVDIIESKLDDLIFDNVLDLTCESALCLTTSTKNKVTKSAFIFNTNMYVYYKIDDKYYFDLNHILASVLQDCAMKYTLHKQLFEKYLHYVSFCVRDFSIKTGVINRPLVDVSKLFEIVGSPLDCYSKFKDTFVAECQLYTLILIMLMFYYKTFYQNKNQIN